MLWGVLYREQDKSAVDKDTGRWILWGCMGIGQNDQEWPQDRSDTPGNTQGWKGILGLHPYQTRCVILTYFLKYVLRHELIALHGAQDGNAQFYPQCINLEVTGGGSASPSGGVPGTRIYQSAEPGVRFNLYTKFTTYPIPGPKKGM
jgi:hypothetical protein